MTKPMDQRLAKNLSEAERFLKRFVESPVPHIVAGERVMSASGETFDTLDPTTNEKQCVVASGGAAEIDRAAGAAERAFRAWRDISGAKRRKILHEIADAIVGRAEEI